MTNSQSETHKPTRYNIRAIDRAVKVLNVLSDGKPRTLTHLSKELEYNNSSTYRLLATLTSHNLVELDESTGNYRLGLACLELARAYHSSNQVRRVALPFMETLRDDTRETVHLGVLADNEVVYVEKLEGLHAIGMMSSRVGGRAPAYCTGIGKVMMAYLESETIRNNFKYMNPYRFTDTTIVNKEELIDHLLQVRQSGYAIDKGEHETEVRCIAAPIFDQENKVVAAISVSGPRGRMDPIESNFELIDRTKQSALEISRRLGYNNNI